MSKWKEVIDDNGDVWIDFGFWKLHCGDMEDLDKEHFEVIHKIVAAPELVEEVSNLRAFYPKVIYAMEDRDREMGEELDEVFIKLKAIIDQLNDNFGEFSEENLLMFSMQRKTNEDKGKYDGDRP